MLPLPPNPVPEIYVLWHPRCPVGELAAHRIHGWLRPGPGLGPHVYYRSLAAPGAPPGGLPLPLPGETRPAPSTALEPFSRRVLPRGNLQVILPLIDEQMIADATWRYWLTQLGEAPDRVVLPIALDSTAFGAPGPIRRLNFLRPAGPPAGDDRADDTFVRSLLKQLTEALCRTFVGTSQAAVADAPRTSTLKLRIFLSHAKLDGAGPARRVRDYIYSQTQIAAFYDENDIPYGSGFGDVLQADVGTAAAMIAVRTAAYASRPWCRREISLFRRPWLRPATPEHVGVEHWHVNPLLVLEAMTAGSSTNGLPEFGNAPHLRWGAGIEDQEEVVVTTLLRDVLLSAFHGAVGRTIHVSDPSVVIDWTPDPITLMGIPQVRDGRELTIYHPGRLTGLDLDILDELFPHLGFESFEEILA